MNDGSTEVTRLLKQAAAGDRSAFARLFPLVYDELKALARHKLAFERDGHTLGATALVHEAYLRLAGQADADWQSRSHFMAVAAQAMRRILVDYARRRGAGKRGGGAGVLPLEAADAETPAWVPDEETDRLVALDDALERLGTFNARGAQVVSYHFFGGLTFAEIATVLGVSEVTARRSWSMARAWLGRELGGLAAPSGAA